VFCRNPRECVFFSVINERVMQLHLEAGIRAEEQRVMNWAGQAQKTRGDLKRPFPRITQDDIASRSVITDEELF